MMDDLSMRLADEEAEIEEEALAGILQGLADAEAGRVTPLEEFEAEFRARNGL